ncbi:MAG: hypothetical protein QXD24_00820 [Candidatus Caldarchaeum sp.]
MNPVTLLLHPSKAKTIDGSREIRKALIVFALAALSQAAVAIYIYRFKTVYEIALGPYSIVELELFQPDYLLMASLTTVFIALVIIVGVGRILGRLLGRNHASMRDFLTVFLYLFTVFAIINVVIFGASIPSAPEKYYVFGAQFSDVIFRNATLTWVDGDIARTIEAELLYAKRANVTRMLSDGKMVETGGYTAEEIQRIISESVLTVSLQNPAAPPYSLPESITLEDFVFQDITPRNTLLTSIAAVRDQPGAYIPTISVVKNFAWRIIMSIYTGLFVMYLHNTSRKSAFLVILLTYLAVANLVPAIS